MNLEELLGAAVNVVDQAAQVVNKGTSIFDSFTGQSEVKTTVPVQTTTPTATSNLLATQFEGPMTSTEYWFEQNKVLILLAIAGLVLWKMR